MLLSYYMTRKTFTLSSAVHIHQKQKSLVLKVGPRDPPTHSISIEFIVLVHHFNRCILLKLLNLKYEESAMTESTNYLNNGAKSDRYLIR